MAFLKHKNCGQDVSIAVLNHDVAYYVYCDTCRDLVEFGELDLPVNENQIRLQVDRSRIRPTFNDDGEQRMTGETVSGDA